MSNPNRPWYVVVRVVAPVTRVVGFPVLFVLVLLLTIVEGIWMMVTDAD